MTIEEKFIYAGPSWANSSFPDDEYSTNLAKEWKIPCIDASGHGDSCLDTLAKVLSILKDKKLPVIWIYNEPISDSEALIGCDHFSFIGSNDWKQLHADCNAQVLRRINDLGVPVLLIGGHCDIYDCDYPNLTVGHPSWQKWLAAQAGMTVENNIIDFTPTNGGNYKLDFCWGPEVFHRIINDNQQLKPSAELLDSIWDIYYFWQELERRDWFFEVHPNKKATWNLLNF